MTDRGPILVTGAGGFVGLTLVTGLAALGYPVIATDRAFDAVAQSALGRIPRFLCDLGRVPEQSLPDLPPCDTIIHAAAITTSPAALGMTDAAHLAANMASLAATIALAERMRPRAFVFLSSSGVFAPGDGAADLSDRDMPTASGPYSAAKKAGEALVPGALGSLCQTHVVRLGYIYGPLEVPRPSRQRVSLVRDWVTRAEGGGTLKVPADDPWRDWTFAPDLAPALGRLISGPGSARPLHLCAPGATRDSELAALILSRYPAGRIVPGPAAGAKAPLRPSDHPAFAGLDWTPLARGLDLSAPSVAA